MTIYERAMELIPDGSVIGLGSGRAAWAFVRLLGERVTAGALQVWGVAASEETAMQAKSHGLPLRELDEAGELTITVDGADEIDPQLNLIKGYGRALVREKVLAASSRKLIILVGEEKLVPQLGTRGRLPIEVVPYALPLCIRRLKAMGLEPTLWMNNGQPATTENGNRILDCATPPIGDPFQMEEAIRCIPGVVGTGLFLGMADIVFVGDKNFELTQELKRAN